MQYSQSFRINAWEYLYFLINQNPKKVKFMHDLREILRLQFNAEDSLLNSHEIQAVQVQRLWPVVHTKVVHDAALETQAPRCPRAASTCPAYQYFRYRSIKFWRDAFKFKAAGFTWRFVLTKYLRKFNFQINVILAL